MGQHQGNGNVDAIKQVLADPQVRAELEKVADGLEKRGWHVLEDGPDPETNTPVRAFTLGLYPNFLHPEIVMVGLSHEFTSHLLTTACEKVQAGEVFQAGSEYDGFLEGFKVAFRQVHPSHYARFLPFLKRYYRTSDFPAVQMVLPDRHGLYPWDVGVQPEFSEIQRVLDEPR